MKTSPYITPSSNLNQLVWSQEVTVNVATAPTRSLQKRQVDPLQPLRQWLDGIELHSPETAKLLCQAIPARCPFERTVKLFGRTLFHIPPMCKLNPLYEQVVGLRFRALCYLADECGEDVTRYC